MTLYQFDELCVICGTMENIEIHHMRFVKDVKVKTRTYAQWIGGFKRESISLCKEHHNLYYLGKLSKDDVKKLSLYKGKAVNYKKKN